MGMVLGLDAGLRLIESLPGIEIYPVTKNLEVSLTSGFENQIVIYGT